jgi:hypothetical protein
VRHANNIKVECIRALLERCFTVFLCAHDPFIVHHLLTLLYSGFPSKKASTPGTTCFGQRRL